MHNTRCAGQDKPLPTFPNYGIALGRGDEEWRAETRCVAPTMAEFCHMLQRPRHRHRKPATAPLYRPRERSSKRIRGTEGRKTGDRRGHAEPANKTQAGASEGCAAGAKHGQPQPKKTGKNVRKPKNEASSQSQGVRGCSGRFPCVLPEFPPPRDHRGQRAPVQEWRVYTVVYVRTSVVTYTVPGRSAESHDAPGAVTVNCVCRWDK
jgi:hypothetical protein